MVTNIYIGTKELIRNVRETFLQEAVAIPNEVAQARPSGIVTEAEFERAVVTADSSLRDSLIRFLEEDSCEHCAYNGREIPDAFTYTLSGGHRRLEHKEHILADTIQVALRETILANLFQSLSVEIAQAHTSTAADSLARLETIMLTKRQPKSRYV